MAAIIEMSQLVQVGLSAIVIVGAGQYFNYRREMKQLQRHDIGILLQLRSQLNALQWITEFDPSHSGLSQLKIDKLHHFSETACNLHSNKYKKLREWILAFSDFSPAKDLAARWKEHKYEHLVDRVHAALDDYYRKG